MPRVFKIILYQRLLFQLGLLAAFLRRLDREEADVKRYNNTIKKSIRTRCELLVESLEGARERQLEIAEMREEEVLGELRAQRAAASLAVERLRKATQDGGRARGELQTALLSRDDLHQHQQRVRDCGTFKISRLVSGGTFY